MLRFEYPAVFLLYLGGLLLVFMRKLKILKKLSFPLIMSDWDGKNYVWHSHFQKFLQVFARILIILAFICLTISFSSPVIRYQKKVFTSRGCDILFVLDVSPSMASKDIALSTRIGAAKKAIRALTEKNTGAAFGLVAMAEEAATLVPPTTDRAFFSTQLDNLRVGTLGDGTAIGTGLSAAVYHLISTSAPKKAIVLITDGENNAGTIHPETAADLARDNDIDFYILGIGTAGTVQIEYVNPDTGSVQVGFYESTFNSKPLELLAEAGGGRYFGIDSMETLSQSLEEISQRQEVSQTYFLSSVDKKLYDVFLLWTVIFICVSWMIRRLLLREIL